MAEADVRRELEQSEATLPSQGDALLLLKFLTAGERDYRLGDVLSDSEADRHFRSRLAALKAHG